MSGGRRDVSGPVTEDLTVHWVLNMDDPSPSWKAATPMPEPGNHLGGCRVGDWIYVVGGQKLQDEFEGNLATVRAYSPKLDTWKLVADLPLPLGHIAASVLEYKGSIIVVGGLTTGQRFSQKVLSYDPATDRWSELTNFLAPRKAPVVGIVGQIVIVSGGEGVGDDTVRGTLSP
jgi:N-acetylneuraminic acid mutarotase